MQSKLSWKLTLWALVFGLGGVAQAFSSEQGHSFPVEVKTKWVDSRGNPYELKWPVKSKVVWPETSEEQKSSTSGEASLEAKIGWGPFSVKIHGKVSHHKEQTRKTDTRAKYTINVAAKRAGPPEGMMRVLDAMVDEAARPKLGQTNSGSTPTPPTTDE